MRSTMLYSRFTTCATTAGIISCSISFFIAHKDEKAAIMRPINEQAGPGTKAGAICFSLPISSVAGLRAREEN